MKLSLVGGDERGGIMYIALVFAIFGVAMIYTTIGITQAALFRQALQDGADANALSGAVMQARSMNLLVLLNIIMAALLSVLVALKLVEAVCIAGMIFAVGAAYPTWGGSLVLLSPFETLRNNVKSFHDNLEDPISNAIEAVHDLSDVVVEVAPGAAYQVAKSTQTSGVQDVLVGMPPEGLPVEDDEFERLCAEAGALPFDLAADTIPLPKKGALKSLITNPLSEAMRAMASTFSSWFCGDGGEGGGPPSYEVTPTVWYPQDDLDEACGSTVSSAINQDYERVASQDTLDCAAKAEEAQAAAPHTETGECLRRCGVNEPYEVKAQLARRVCNPASENFTWYSYQTRVGQVEYTWKNRQWVRGTPDYETPVLVEKGIGAPCGTSKKKSLSPEYNLVVRKSDDVNELIPVCSDEIPPNSSPRGRAGSNPQVVEFVEVTHILACAREEARDVQVDATAFASGSSDSSGSEDGAVSGEGGSDDVGTSEQSGASEQESEDSEEKRLPKRVKGKLNLGDDDFKLRVITVGKANTSSAEKAVRLALWNRDEKQNPFNALRTFGGFNLAQAEFFYAGNAEGSDLKDSDAWMWNMYWQARLVRFRATEEQLEPLYIECDGLFGVVADLVGELDAVGLDGVLEPDACRPFLDKVLELGPLITH